MIGDVVQFVYGVGSLVKGGVKLGGKIAKGAKAVKELEKGARLTELAKTFVAGAKDTSELNSAASKAAKVAKLRVVRESEEAKKVEKAASAAEKFRSELDVLKQRAREIPRTLTDDEIRACEAVKLQMKGKLPEPGKVSVAEVEKIDEAVRAANASGKVESAANVESVAESAKQGMSGITDDVFTMGKEVFDRFDVNRAYVKPKHLSTTGGNGQKFLGESKASAENVLRDVISKGKIISISDNGLTKAGNASYEIIIDAGKPVGTRGENLVKIVISSDGGMLSAYPIK